MATRSTIAFALVAAVAVLCAALALRSTSHSTRLKSVSAIRTNSMRSPACLQRSRSLVGKPITSFKQNGGDGIVPSLRKSLSPKAIEIDFSDPEIQLAITGAFLGLAGGIGFPIFYKLRDDADQERLKEIKEMNRQQFEETGQYMTDDEIAALRPKRYLDDKEFVDDD
mmetsp:Transcript_14811/g.22439  ORF Transcript_14811/g.22439 Transcript_14811/m.22439 type:complete len:168 (-) Transcript_14811:250-753(-)